MDKQIKKQLMVIEQIAVDVEKAKDMLRKEEDNREKMLKILAVADEDVLSKAELKTLNERLHEIESQMETYEEDIEMALDEYEEETADLKQLLEKI